MDTRTQLGKRITGLADLVDSKTRALRVSDIASLLNISERAVYKLSAEHRIPFFRIGGSIRFDPAITANWLRQQMTASITMVNDRRRA